MTWLLILGISFFSAHASVVRTVPGASEYTVVGLTAAEDVFFTTCEGASYPEVNCDVDGTKTWLIQKDLFVAKLNTARDYDENLIQTNASLKQAETLLEDNQNRSKEIEERIAATNNELKALRAQLKLTESQIAAAEKRLRDPNMSPHDRSELEGFVEKSKVARGERLADIAMGEEALARMEESKRSVLAEIADGKAELVRLVDSKEARLKELGQKSAELMRILNEKEATITFLNETLFFLSGFVFLEEKVVPESECVVTDFKLLDGLGKARATFQLTGGIFPLKAKAGFRNFQSEFTVDLNTAQIGYEKNWVRQRHGGVVTYFSARTKKEVWCKHKLREIPGEEENFYHRSAVESGFYAWLFYAGRFKGSEARDVCKGMVDGWDGNGRTNYIFGPQFRDSESPWGQGVARYIMPNMSRYPIFQYTRVESTPPLADGYYAWANDKGTRLFRFSEGYNRPEVVDVPESLRDMPFPTICTEIVAH